MNKNAYQADAAAYLQKIAALFDDYKRRSIAYLDLKPGETLLDCGCGAGDDLLAIAAATQGSVKLIGVDLDEQTLKQARSRAKQAGVDIDFKQGSLSALPLADHAVDVARVDRVLQHIPDIASALAELKRVVKPGGRLVAVDVDWGSLVLDHPNADLTDQLVAFIRDQHIQGRAGRQLLSWFQESGLKQVDGYADVVRVTDWEIAAFIWGLQASLQAMVEAGKVSQEKADAWLCDAAHHADKGHFQSAMTGFAVKGFVSKA
jgi:ubiquinone/menaquinone biosynthesis C-methylase UbiE